MRRYRAGPEVRRPELLDDSDGETRTAPGARGTPLASQRGDTKVARRRLSDQVAEALKDRLLAGRLPTGSPLPTEMELAQHYGVSRTVVREAGRILLEWGLVDIRPGRGMVVADYNGSTLARQYELMVALNAGSFAQLMEMRLALEVAIAITEQIRKNRK
jgi:DNA-binding FadR family transcriptional regulator